MSKLPLAVSLLGLAAPCPAQESLSPTAARELVAATESRSAGVETSVEQLRAASAARSPELMASLAARVDISEACPQRRTRAALTLSQRKELASLQTRALASLSRDAEAGGIAGDTAKLAIAATDSALACDVLGDALTSSDARLREAALALQDAQDSKSRLRESISDLREVLSDDTWPAQVTYVDAQGVERTQTLLTREQAETLLEDLEAALAAANDTTPVLQQELQNALSRQQQLTNMLSAMLKATHDSARAIVQNLR